LKGCRDLLLSTDEMIINLKEIQQEIRDSKICYARNKEDNGKPLNLVRISMRIADCVLSLSAHAGEMSKYADTVSHSYWMYLRNKTKDYLRKHGEAYSSDIADCLNVSVRVIHEIFDELEHEGVITS